MTAAMKCWIWDIIVSRMFRREMSELHQLQYLYLSENGYSSFTIVIFRTEKSSRYFNATDNRQQQYRHGFLKWKKWKKSVFTNNRTNGTACCQRVEKYPREMHLMNNKITAVPDEIAAGGSAGNS